MILTTLLRRNRVKNMTKLSRRKIETNKMGEYINDLWSAFTLMDSKEKVRLLFKDLVTHTELKMWAKRLGVACRLIDQVST